MDFPENLVPMTAMKVTKEFMQHCIESTQSDPIPDDDPIYMGYVVVLPDGEFTIAPNAEEFFSVFEFIGPEIPGQFAPIKHTK